MSLIALSGTPMGGCGCQNAVSGPAPMGAEPAEDRQMRTLAIASITLFGLLAYLAWRDPK